MKSKFSTPVCHLSRLSLEHSVPSFVYILLEMGYVIKYIASDYTW